MKRRSFLQLSTITAAGAALSGCKSANEKLIPYLIPADEGVAPGQATQYASCCNFCAAGCGILVRVSEGRAKKIEGNPSHPVNRGKLCVRGQAYLQELYHPDRLQQPLKASGPRGSGQFVKISWKEGLDLLAGQLKKLQQERAGERLALLTPSLAGTLADLTGAFMRSFGSPHHISFDLLGHDWLRSANRADYGQSSLPWYDLAETRYLLSFGADFVESHLSPVQYGYAFGRMRQGRDTVRGHFTYVGGRMSLTAASADRWMPARPGSEGALALGMARLILAESLFDRDSLLENGLKPEKLLQRLKGYDLPRVEQLTGLDQKAIAEVAREFATTRPGLAMAGETVAFQSNGPEAVRAIQLLNLLVGSLNRPGGIYPDGGSPGRPVHTFDDLLGLIRAMSTKRIRIALIQGDPVHTLPPSSGFQEALAGVPFIVSFSRLLDDSALQADLILPDNAGLESWGDVIPMAGSRNGVIGLMQPVVTPLYDTRQFADTLLSTARLVGGATAAALAYPSYLEMLKGRMAKLAGHGEGEDAERAWVELLRKGGHFEPDSAREKSPGFRRLRESPLPAPAEPAFSGDRKNFPLHLQLFPSSAFHDGRGAPLPWLQQLPDPMTSVVWDSWVEINPRTAAELGIAFGDLVEVSSPRASLRLPAVIYPGIRPDMVAIPLGQGQRDSGRYARGRGVNPLTLLELEIDGKGPLPAWNATRVKIARVSSKGELVTAGNPQGSYRSELIGI